MRLREINRSLSITDSIDLKFNSLSRDPSIPRVKTKHIQIICVISSVFVLISYMIPTIICAKKIKTNNDDTWKKLYSDEEVMEWYVAFKILNIAT